MLKPREIQKLKDMRNNGAGYREIAEKLNCSQSTVYNYCRQLGLLKGSLIEKAEESLDELTTDQIMIPDKTTEQGISIFERMPLTLHLEFFEDFVNIELENLKKKIDELQISLQCPDCGGIVYPLYFCRREGKRVMLVQ